jgi:hypothetical protein
MDGPAILALIQSGGALAVTAIVIWTGLTQKWLFRWQHDLIVSEMGKQVASLQSDRDRWQEIALRGTSLARDAVNAHIGGGVGGAA